MKRTPFPLKERSCQGDPSQTTSAATSPPPAGCSIPPFWIFSLPPSPLSPFFLSPSLPPPHPPPGPLLPASGVSGGGGGGGGEKERKRVDGVWVRAGRRESTMEDSGANLEMRNHNFRVIHPPPPLSLSPSPGGIMPRDAGRGHVLSLSPVRIEVSFCERRRRRWWWWSGRG